MSAMHIGNVVTRATPRPAAKAAPATRREPVAAESEPTREKEPKAEVTRPEFAALLALLAGMGQQVRNDLVQQLPDEAASLVDRLLLGAGEEGANDTAPGDDSMPLTKPSIETPDDLTHAVLHGGSSNASRGDIVDLAAYARARDGRTEPAMSTAATAGREAQAHEHAHETLARITTQRAASIEQMLAVGDARGADARAALDALIAQAGTPAGARLAARRLMQSTTSQLLMPDSVGGAGALPNPGDAGFANLTTAAANAAESARRRADALARRGDVGTPIKDLELVAPELRAKVVRVVERMKNEYGHDVTIVETARSQERQDWLYEQGRTRGGPVVTWTRDSAHTRGEAVDVLIDGSWDNAAGFARLQRIAREEGLRTLGMKDPGHLELATRGGPVDAATAAMERVDRQIPRPEPAATTPGMAQVAGVAGVAGIARVADTAGAARTATTGSASMADGLAAYAVSRAAERSSNDSGHRGDHESGRDTHAGHHTAHDHHDASAPAFGAALGTTGAGAGTATERATATAAPAGSVQADRVSDIQQMRADAPAAPLSRMTLNVDNANGTRETITVDVRGNTVNTQITTDAATAERIRMRSADLQDALGRQGLESDRLRVGATRPQDGADAARSLAGEREALKVQAAPQSSAQDGASGNGQRERAPAREWNQDESRREQAARARDERQQQQQDRQERQRRAIPFFGIE